MKRRASRVLLLVAVWAVLAQISACAMPSWMPFTGEKAPAEAAPDESFGLSEVSDASVMEFYDRATFFYQRLRLRRVNTLATYRDEVLRDFFRTDAAFADYYADLSQSLVDAHFERNRPLTLDVVEFRLEGPGVAEVITRVVGKNGLPLRWWKTRIDRVDRWERIQGRWWIVPRRL